MGGILYLQMADIIFIPGRQYERIGFPQLKVIHLLLVLFLETCEQPRLQGSATTN